MQPPVVYMFFVIELFLSFSNCLFSQNNKLEIIFDDPKRTSTVESEGWSLTLLLPATAAAKLVLLAAFTWARPLVLRRGLPDSDLKTK